MKTHYRLLSATGSIPELGALTEFKAVVVVEVPVTKERLASICRELVASGCRYLMAWGSGCSDWEDGMNLVSLETVDSGEIPDDRVVIVTSHPDESLQDVFWFAKYTAMHPCHALDDVVLLHLSSESREEELLAAYADA